MGSQDKIGVRIAGVSTNELLQNEFALVGVIAGERKLCINDLKQICDLWVVGFDEISFAQEVSHPTIRAFGID